MNKKIKIGIYILIALALVLWAIPGKQNPLGGLVQSLESYPTASSTVFTIGPDETVTLLPAKSNRGYIQFQNLSGTDHFLCLAATCAVNTGSLVAASSTYEIDGDNLYTGAVTANAYASTSISVTELRF